MKEKSSKRPIFTNETLGVNESSDDELDRYSPPTGKKIKLNPNFAPKQTLDEPANQLKIDDLKPQTELDASCTNSQLLTSRSNDLSAF